jgi:hypothetical protein
MKTHKLELNGTHQLVVYADDNLLDENIHTIQKNTEALLDARKEGGREVRHRENMLMFYHQTAGQNHNINIANKSLKNVTKFKHPMWE